MEAGKTDAGAKDQGYVVPPDFVENTKEPLVDITMNDSTELWLVQFPKEQNPDYNGQDVTLKLNQGGKIGSFEGSSGKEYDIESGAYQQPNATVFVSSTSGTKIAGKISRMVSIVHYPVPSELEERVNSKKMKQMYPGSSPRMLLSQSSNKFATPTRSSMTKNPRSSGGHPTSTHSSRPKSSLYSGPEPSQVGKKRHAPEPTRSMNPSSQSSGRGHSGVSSARLGHAGTSSGQGRSPATSSGQAHTSKLKKKSKHEN